MTAYDQDGEEEEKNEGARAPKRHDLPYSAPNVHPYAVPQYDQSIYGDDATSPWGSDSVGDHSRGATIDIVFSGMYTLAAALTIIQGFAMMVHFTFASGTICR